LNSRLKKVMTEKAMNLIGHARGWSVQEDEADISKKMKEIYKKCAILFAATS